MDREFNQIKELLQLGKRQRDHARGRIRTLLAMESHVAEGVEISEADIDRVEKAIRGGPRRRRSESLSTSWMSAPPAPISRPRRITGGTIYVDGGVDHL